jgi:DNA-binding transcriptional LysR family regulator
MEFRHLRTFETIAQLMSFNRAAQALHCTQSTVSAQIKALERDLGVPVFERLGRRITLTAAGEELLHHTRRLFDYEREIFSAVRGGRDPAGVLSLRVPQLEDPIAIGAAAHAAS